MKIALVFLALCSILLINSAKIGLAQLNENIIEIVQEDIERQFVKYNDNSKEEEENKEVEEEEVEEEEVKEEKEKIDKTDKFIKIKMKKENKIEKEEEINYKDIEIIEELKEKIKEQQQTKNINQKEVIDKQDIIKNDKFLEKVKILWQLFITNFKREYKNELEMAKRFYIFAENVKNIMEHNELYNNKEVAYEQGINNFTDKTELEYRQLLGYRSELRSKKSKGSTFLRSAVPLTLPSSVDWRTKGAVTEVKDQGQCGSCWAFSTTGSLEGQQFRKSGKLISLSEQQLVDCSAAFGNMGCNGGLMDNSFAYIKANKGIDDENDYVYVSGKTGTQNPTCQFKPEYISANDTGFVDITTQDEEALAEAVATVGPVSIAINAMCPGFMQYKSGIYNSPCPGNRNNLDHGVLVVGYGQEGNNGIKYWIVKNSWGANWGENGYIRIAKNKGNLCGIATAASYPLV